MNYKRDELIGITLEEAIKKIKRNCILKIGSGSNFIYAYYHNALTEKRIQKESEKHYNYYTRCLCSANSRLENIPKTLEKQINTINKSKKKKTKKESEINELKRLAIINETKTKKLIESYKKLIDNFIPFQKRRVKDVYESDQIFEPNTLIIIVNGKEMGGYAFIDEYAYENKLDIKKEDMHFTQERLAKAKKEKKKDERN